MEVAREDTVGEKKREPPVVGKSDENYIRIHKRAHALKLAISGNGNRTKLRAAITVSPDPSDACQQSGTHAHAPNAIATSNNTTRHETESAPTVFGNLEVAADDVGQVDQASLGHAQLDPRQGGNVRRHRPKQCHRDVDNSRTPTKAVAMTTQALIVFSSRPFRPPCKHSRDGARRCRTPGALVEISQSTRCRTLSDSMWGGLLSTIVSHSSFQQV